CRANSQGSKTAGPPRADAAPLRTGHQPQNRQGARPDSAADAAGRGRRGDRMKRRAFISLLGGAASNRQFWRFAMNRTAISGRKPLDIGKGVIVFVLMLTAMLFFPRHAHAQHATKVLKPISHYLTTH